MAVDVKLVKELRELTGLPMMDCKKALEEAGGDVKVAQENLRKQGQKVAEGKAHRATREGRVAGYIDPQGTYGVIVSVRCETEPVAKCEDFVNFHDGIVTALKESGTAPSSTDELLTLPHPSGKTVGETLEELVGKIRENIQVGEFSVLKGDAVFQYIHFDSRHGSMVVLQGADPAAEGLGEVGKNLCMHVVFARPQFMSRDEVPADAVEKEREILRAAAEGDPKHAKKPEEIRQKIVVGKLNRYFSERCLPEQPFVRDDKISVEQYIKQNAKEASLTAFAYIGLAS